MLNYEFDLEMQLKENKKKNCKRIMMIYNCEQPSSSGKGNEK